MKIDLEKVCSYSKDGVLNRTLLRSIILDLYPDETLEMNVLLSVYESGVTQTIKRAGRVTDEQYAVYVKRISDAYGLKEKYIIEGLDAWIDYCIAPGTAELIEKPSFQCGQNDKTTTDDNYECNEKQNSSGTGNKEESRNIRGINDTENQDKIAVEEKSTFRFPLFFKKSDRKTEDVSKEKTPEQSSKKEDRTSMPQKDVIGKNSDYDTIAAPGNAEAVIITGFRGFAEAKMTVPGRIGNKRVVGVGDHAYEKCKEVESLVISEGIQIIGDGAFAGCENLIEVYLPNSLKRIGALNKSYVYTGAFKDTGLRSVSIPSGVTYIGEGTFHGCRHLESVSFPGSIKIIYPYTFCGCESLTQFDIPNGVEEIENRAFCATGLTSVVLPRSMERVGEYAFLNCKRLTCVILNEGLKEIEDFSFSTYSIKEMLFSRTVSIFGDKVFGNIKPKLVAYCYAGTEGLAFARREGFQIKDANALNNRR